MWDGAVVALRYDIGNSDRTIGAALGGALALEFGSTPPPGTAAVRFDGSAGQSFGAFLGPGIEFELVGEANDYVGKAMAGGRIVIRPPRTTPGRRCWPATPASTAPPAASCSSPGRRASASRCATRAPSAVVEGVGDHACEYMTGGLVVILGPVGYNLGAGMTGGQAFVWDPAGHLSSRLNTALVEAARPDDELVEVLRWRIERHAELTGSSVAIGLLQNWLAAIDDMWLVAPVDQIRRMEAQRASQVTGV